MTGFMLYIIKGTLYLSVFIAFYMLVMRKTTFIRLNRAMFLGGTFLCMVLPLIEIDMPEGVAMEMPMAIIENALAPAVMTAVGQEGAAVSAPETAAVTTLPVIGIILLAGMIVTLFITARSYFLMRRMLRSVPVTSYDGTPVRITDTEIPSFSWGRHIVISRNDLEENPAILTHEKMHVRCGHSIDLTAYTIVTVMHWFNPLVWIARTELKMLHEYEADELTINQGIDATQYQLLLVKKAVGAKRFQLANGFNHSKLKNRITMMHKNKTNRWMRLAYILCAPVLIGTMCLCSSPDISSKKIRNITVIIKTPQGQDILNDFTLEDLEAAVSDNDFSPLEVSVGIMPQEGYSETDLDAVKAYLQKFNKAKETDSDAVGYSALSAKPEFDGKEVYSFSRWVNSQLKYPEEAKEKNIEGRVTLSFTVTETGKVSDVKVLRGADPLLDKEAVRVVESSPDWTPGMKDGKPVPVTYTFPVIFQLNDTEDTDTVPFQLADRKPTFNGGDANEFLKWVNANISYPENCRKNGISGRVFLSFTVSATGKVTDVKVLRGVHEELDKEAVRVLEMSPEWTPGMKDGKIVPVSYNFPVTFQL